MRDYNVVLAKYRAVVIKAETRYEAEKKAKKNKKTGESIVLIERWG